MGSRYMQVVQELVPYDGSPEELVTMTEAAEILGISISGVAAAMGRGVFPTLVHDTQKTWGGRRLLVRSEVLVRRETVRR